MTAACMNAYAVDTKPGTHCATWRQVKRSEKRDLEREGSVKD